MQLVLKSGELLLAPHIGLRRRYIYYTVLEQPILNFHQVQKIVHLQHRLYYYDCREETEYALDYRTRTWHPIKRYKLAELDFFK